MKASLKNNSIVTKRTDGILLHIYVQPKSSTNAIAGIYQDALKIKLTAPPVDGGANRMCIKFLSKQLGLPASTIEIISGHTGRRKQILIHIDEKSVSERERTSDAILKKIDTWSS